MTKRILHPFRACLGFVLVTGALLGVTTSISAGEVAVARNSTIRAVPTVAQRIPLAALVRTTFPASVTRVGQAIETLLAPSGYRLARAPAENSERAALLALPLLEVHRALGPMPLRLALQTLAGSVFIVFEGPLHGLVSFERRDTESGEQVP